jgi:hypothetical protein
MTSTEQQIDTGPVAPGPAAGELQAMEAQVAEARDESHAVCEVGWGYWRGSPELVSQVARTAQYGLSHATGQAEVACTILVRVDDDVEQYSSPEAFNVGISGEALKSFSVIHLALEATRDGGPTLEVFVTFQRAAARWASVNPAGGKSEIAILTVSGPAGADEDVRSLTRWIYLTAKRGAPWWKVTPLESWSLDGQPHRSDSEFLQHDPGGRRRDKAFGALGLVLWWGAGAAVGVLTAAATTYLVGTSAWPVEIALLVLATLAFIGGMRWVIPDVEVARYRETRLDKVGRRGMQAGVSVLLAVLTKRVFRQ